jgi:hypothetical protein
MRSAWFATLTMLTAMLAVAFGATKPAGPAGPASTSSPATSSVSPFDAGLAKPTGQIDTLVFDQLARLNIKPAPICSDAVFVRRVFLDVIGTLPTASEARDFIADKSPGKRRLLIDRLLDRPEFADYWAMKWADTLRIKAEFPIKLWPKAAQTYYRWIHACIGQNTPYDQLARGMLLACGSSYYAPQANFYRAVQNRDSAGLAQAVALTFMGQRAERWPKQKLADLAVFFSQVSYKYTGEWKEEIVYLDPAKTDALPASAHLPDGSVAILQPGCDARKVFADWLTSPRNPEFSQSIVNRVWCWLMGRGIVQECDDIRGDNPPTNPKLLAYLQSELVSSGYNLQAIYKLILNSQTYQLSSIPQSDDPRALANFAYYQVRPLEAEVLIDALCQISGTGERYVSVVPEPFTYLPIDMRAINISDGNTSSAFLELFDRPARDTGLISERSASAKSGQRLHMLNSTHVQNKIANGPKMRQLLAQPRTAPKALADTLYLTILSRHPTDDELRIMSTYSRSSTQLARDAVMDIAWALINSEEFLNRH